MMRRIFILSATLVALGLPAKAEAPTTITLDLPLKCRMGTDCFIQQYFDHQPGAGAKDYRCGTMSYDGHSGTDFRVPTQALQKRGVAVVASADGTVIALRDGMDDIAAGLVDSASVSNRECGNGVVLRHAGGWETQYCHMAKSSLRVQKGQIVSRGTVLGMVGESGNAAFFHLDLSVRHNGAKIDPFAVNAQHCGSGTSLWSAGAATALAYRSPDVINNGFASQVVSMVDVETGRAGIPAPTGRSAALVAFVRAIGLNKGDLQVLTLSAPDGSVLARNAAPPLDHDKAQWLIYSGKKLKTPSWPPGRYAATYEVRRTGKVVLTRRFALALH